MAGTALKAVVFLLGGVLLVACMLFLPAGTFDYWQAWLYLGALFLPMVAVLLYFLKRDPGFLERRFQAKEKEKEQQLVQMLSLPIFLIGFLLPGLDRRFGWSSVPSELSIAADVAVLLGYALVFVVFRENSYASRTIRVEKGQKVVSSGPYSAVRHPMYAGMLLLCLASPVALGSYVALVPFLFWPPLLALRIKNEEEVLRRELAGYTEYCKKVKWRLVPGIW